MEFNNIEVFDATDWYRRNGNKSLSHYKPFLALFICHGVLFENFLTEGKERDFTFNVVLPAFKTVEQLFGMKPLIVRLLPRESEADKKWMWYPGHLEKEVLRCLDSCKR